MEDNSMINRILDFLDSIKHNGDNFFIEAEAKPVTMNTFIGEYNRTHTPTITINSEGIIVLQEDANKWALELRLYVPIAPPADIAHLFGRNRVYKTEYSYRLNDNGIIRELFNNGCKIGLN